MKTHKVTIVVTKSENEGYICTCDYPFEYFDLDGSGATVEEAKKTVLHFMMK